MVRETRTPVSFHTHAIEPVLDLVGRPLWERLVGAATRLRSLQATSLRWYLLYSILCLLGLLLYIRFMRVS